MTAQIVAALLLRAVAGLLFGMTGLPLFFDIVWRHHDDYTSRDMTVGITASVTFILALAVT